MLFALIRANYRKVTSLSRSFSVSSVIMGKKVALVLSGCGVFDGSEIHEASACLVHLSRHDAKVTVFAPNMDLDEMDHLNSKPTGAKRNVLVESARIARGEISDLSGLKATDYDALVMPGGFGAAKNLCTFASDGAGCHVIDDVVRVLKEFKAAKKPMGFCCIAPVIPAKVLSCEVTIGGDKETAQAIKKMGAKHVNTSITEAHVDSANKVVTSGAFMFDAPIHKVFDNVGIMIKQTLDLA